MPRLTSKQESFAMNIVLGGSLVSAYRAAYVPANPKAPSVYTNARRARKHPGIARRIAELQVKLLPGPEDLKAVYRHALAVGLQLSILGKDDRVRLRAAQWVAAEAEKGEKLAEEARKLHDEDLEKLQQILEAPTMENDVPAKSAAEILAEIRRVPAVEQRVPKPATSYVDECVSPPGQFPPRFRMVPSEI